MATATTTTQAPTDDEFVGPCGCGGCDKWADCAYCGTCIARDPWAAADAEAHEAYLWDRENSGSFGDWLAAR